MALATGDIITYNGSIWVNQPGVPGNFGVGTASPSARFQVNGGYQTSGLSGIAASLYIGADGGTPAAAQIRWGDNTGWKLHFGTKNSSNAFVERVTFLDTGNVGIGTTAPTEKLHVSGGNVRIDNTRSLIFSDSATPTPLNGFTIVVNGDNSVKLSQNNSQSLTLHAGFTDNSSNAIVFSTGDPGASPERARITNGGNLGIGLATNIDAKLTLAASTVAAGGILFGADTNLYRSAADTLRTDDSFGVGVTPGVSGFENNFATALSGDISPAALTGNVNDWSPTGLSTATVIRVDPGGEARQITGIAGGADGRLLLLCNIATVTATLTLMNDVTSTAANRILGVNGANVIITPGGSCLLWYDSTSSRWRCVTT